MSLEGMGGERVTLDKMLQFGVAARGLDSHRTIPLALHLGAH